MKRNHHLLNLTLTFCLVFTGLACAQTRPPGVANEVSFCENQLHGAIILKN